MKRLLWLLFVSILILNSCSQQEQQGDVAKSSPTASLDVQSSLVSPTAMETSISTDGATINSPLPTIALAPQLEKYHGHSSYGSSYPDFEIWYDPSIWEYVSNPVYQDDSSKLINIREPNCSLMLQSGATDAVMESPIDINVEIAGRWWNYKLMSLISNTLLSYSTDYENIAYIFDVSLPETYDEQHQSKCQHFAEAVLETFTLVEPSTKRSE